MRGIEMPVTIRYNSNIPRSLVANLPLSPNRLVHLPLSGLASVCRRSFVT
jgi:hypothetical protein